MVKATAVQISAVLYGRQGTVGVNGRDGGLIYNTQLLFDANGTLIQRRRKIRPIMSRTLLRYLAEKIVKKIRELGKQDVQFATLSETVVLCNPYLSFVQPAFAIGKEHERLLEQSVSVPSAETRVIGEAAKNMNMVVSVAIPSRRLGDDPMASEMQKIGIDVVGDMVAWGAHFCLFYETTDDLLDTLISYCKAGLEREEYCLWIVAEPLTIEGARDALKDAVPNLDRCLADSCLEIVSARDWYLQDGKFDGRRVTAAWYEKLARVSARGYPGMRVTGDTTWLLEKDWRHFCDYEDGLNEVIGNQRLALLCTYPLAACGAPQILDVVRTHQFVLARRYGSWDVVETAALKRAKAEIQGLNEELEQRVAERTSQLMQTSDALREARMELAHANSVATMGQLAASITHEIKQPIAAAVFSAQAASRWLGTQPPNLDQAQASLTRIVTASNRAINFVDRIRNLFKRAPPRKEPFDINEAVLEVIALTRGEVAKKNVSVQTQLAEGLPHIQGDRVQLEQVILNLVINAVEAMSGVSEGSRQLLIRTGKDASGGVLVVVQDSGLGVSPESFDRLFDAFYTTKPGGMGMGLSICRSIVEAHDGHLWAVPHDGPGATFQFTLRYTGRGT